MFDDPALRDDAQKAGLEPELGPQPADEDIVKALVEIETTSRNSQPPADSSTVQTRSPFYIGNLSPVDRVRLTLVIIAFVCGSLYASWSVVRAYLTRHANSTHAASRSVDAGSQAQAEQLLRRLATGDLSAARETTAQAPNWLGRTTRSETTNQFLTTAINRHEREIREAALEAELAMDGVPKNNSGLALLTQAAGNASQRAWALWMLGALGNRGVDQVHVAKIIGSYLDDPATDIRAAAVNGLALLGTDETVPMLLDRLRNDPSPVVQERAACAIAESGMYTHAQRVEAAGTLIGWLDDSLVNAQQRTWIVQALGDISGQRLGTDSAAWRDWYASVH
jgi:hypothetical protein